MPTQEELDEVREAGQAVVEAFASYGLSASMDAKQFEAAVWKIPAKGWDELDELVVAMHGKGDGLGPPNNEDWPPLDGFPDATGPLREAAADPSIRADSEEVVVAIQDVLGWISGDGLIEHLASYAPTAGEASSPEIDPAELERRREELSRKLQALEEEDAQVEEAEQATRSRELGKIDAALSEVRASRQHLEPKRRMAERLPPGQKRDVALAEIDTKLRHISDEEALLEEKRGAVDHPDTELIARRHEEIGARRSAVRQELDELGESSAGGAGDGQPGEDQHEGSTGDAAEVPPS